MIDAYASQPHYVAHMAPVWHALSPELRGGFSVMGNPAIVALRSRGLIPGHVESGAVLTAGAVDTARMRRLGGKRLVRMEHGVGLFYPNDRRYAAHPAYPGGRGQGDVSLFLAPNETSAQAWREAYPSARIEVIGATYELPPPEGKDIVLSFHWQGHRLVGWKAAILRLAHRHEVVLHAHPRVADSVAAWARTNGLAFDPVLESVARRAAVYLSEWSSTLYEVGRTRPAILLGARHPSWDPPGRALDDPKYLETAVDEALSETDEQRTERERVVAKLIPSVDGAPRAAAILSEWVA